MFVQVNAVFVILHTYCNITRTFFYIKVPAIFVIVHIPFALSDF